MASVPNWKLISPSAQKKLAPILSWARKQQHPHRECRNALVKRGVPLERANKICAVMKDRALGTTKWRKGG